MSLEKNQFSYLLQRVVTRSKDIIRESNWKLRQAIGNIRCHLENQVLRITNAHRVPGALGNTELLRSDFNPRLLTV